MYAFKRGSLVAVLLATAMLAGCASVPMASPQADAQAKTFAVKKDKASIYVYRNETFGAAIAMPVSLDNKLVGRTAAHTYFLLEVEPGTHEITSLTENTASVKLNAEAGKAYYVWQEVKMGMFQPRSDLKQVEEAAGQKGVNECKRIESAM